MKEENDLKSSKIWTKDMMLILLISFLSATVMNMHASTISLFVLHLGGSKSSIGLVIGIISVSALLCRPLVGNLLDHRGKQIMLMIGLLAVAIISLAFNLAFSVGMLIFFRLALGVGASTQGTAIGTIITDITPQGQLGKTFGYNSLIGTAATAVGSYVGINIVQKFNYNVFFTAIFVCGMLAFLLSTQMNYEKRLKVPAIKPETVKTKSIKTKGDQTVKTGRFNMSAIVEKSAVPYCLVNLFIFFAFPGVNAFMPAYAASQNIKGIGTFFIVYPIAFVAGRFLMTILENYWETRRLIIIGMLLMILSFYVCAMANTLNMLLIGGVFYGVGSSSVFPGLNSLAVVKCKPEKRGVANSTYLASIDLGYFVGSLSWGVLAQLTGYKATYLVSGVFSIAALVVFLAVVKNKTRKVELSY